MWIIQCRKYGGILSTLCAFNNVINVTKGKLRVATPSGIAYAELQVPELDEDIDKLFNFSPLVAMMSSKVANEVFFSPGSQIAMYRTPYIYKDIIPEVDDTGERGAVDTVKDIPDKIVAAVGDKSEGVYVDDDGETFKACVITVDNMILVDMARRLGAPRVILTIKVSPQSLTLSTQGDTPEESKTATYPKPRELDYPSSEISITLSMEAQPMVFGSLMGPKSTLYIVDNKFVMVASQNIYKFVCASYAGAEAFSEQLEGFKI